MTRECEELRDIINSCGMSKADRDRALDLLGIIEADLDIDAIADDIDGCDNCGAPNADNEFDGGSMLCDICFNAEFCDECDMAWDECDCDLEEEEY